MMSFGRENRNRIISVFLHVLKDRASCVARQSELPFSIALIRRDFREELTENPYTEHRDHLETVFVQLESFLAEADYRTVQGFQLIKSLAQEECKEPHAGTGYIIPTNPWGRQRRDGR